MFEKEYTVRYSEVTTDALASLGALVSYFQDTTMFHSDSLGQGINNLMQDNTAWLLVSWHIKINRYPRYKETIRAYTWATKFAGVYGYRDFKITDKNDEVLAVASSAWFLYDSLNQKLQRVTPEVADAYNPEPDFVFGVASEPRLHVPKKYEDIYECVAEKRDLDTNNHVNNVHYIDYALEALPEEFTATELRVSYKNAAVLGDRICVGVNKENEVYTCVIHNGGGNVYAVLEFK